jgi:outer membrane protein OmpA-like peptidoglycan-associated protein
MRIWLVLIRRLRTHGGWLALLCCVSAAISSAQVQTAPITEPRAQQEPAPTIAKGATAIKEQPMKCSTQLVVNADALFAPHRWTLNHDAAQTLDVLGPMITQAGKHPARIDAYTAAADSDAENRDVAQRRALTVRTWLVNHQLLPAGTPIAGFSSSDPPQGGAPSSDNKPRQKNGTVEVVIQTCN